MFDKLVARMVARAVPRGLEPDQEFVAALAAENGIRQTAFMGTIVAAVLVLATAAAFYGYSLNQPVREVPVEAPRPARQLGGDNVKPVQANAELQKQLEEAMKERDTLQAKVGDLERQQADLKSKLQGAQAGDAQKAVRQPAKRVSAPAQPRVPASPRHTFRCGDGRTVLDPADCKAAQAPAPRVGASPGTYACGDGRAVRDPSECRPAGSSSPGR